MGREAKNTVLPESYFYIQIFSLFFIFTLFHFFLHFYNFQIFSLFYIFTIFRFFSSMYIERVWITPPPPTFLHFYNFSGVTLVVVFFLCGEMLKKIFFGGGGPDSLNNTKSRENKVYTVV